MSKPLKELLFDPSFFETHFIDAEGKVYRIQSVASHLPESGRLSNVFGALKRLCFGDSLPVDFDYGIAHCRLGSNIRYTISLGDHLNDRTNPTIQEIQSSEKQCADLVESFGDDRLYLTA